MGPYVLCNDLADIGWKHLVKAHVVIIFKEALKEVVRHIHLLG
jgi:hypothetical protein